MLIAWFVVSAFRRASDSHVVRSSSLVVRLTCQPDTGVVAHVQKAFRLAIGMIRMTENVSFRNTVSRVSNSAPFHLLACLRRTNTGACRKRALQARSSPLIKASLGFSQLPSSEAFLNPL